MSYKNIVSFYFKFSSVHGNQNNVKLGFFYAWWRSFNPQLVVCY